MLSVIKTAIITIIISFISGVLLDSYKNFAPRILCTMGKPVRLMINDKKMWAFTLIMRNISNKTIHHLNLNIQGHNDNLKIDEEKITKGLKFESCSEKSGYNISIPFLSKNDEFSVKIIVESRNKKIRKPIVALRSPEDFKRIDSTGKNGYLATIAGIPKDISDSLNKRKYKKQNTSFNNRMDTQHDNFNIYKKTFITIVGIIMAIYTVMFVTKYYDSMASNIPYSSNDSNTQQSEASLGKTNDSVNKSSNSTDDTSSTLNNAKSSSNKITNQKKINSLNTKSSEDISKNAGENSASSDKNENTKTSENTQNENISTASAGNKSPEVNNNKNSENNEQKKSSTENPKTEEGTSANKKIEEKDNNKETSEKKEEESKRKGENNTLSPAQQNNSQNQAFPSEEKK